MPVSIMDLEIQKAIEVAFDARASQDLKSQAFEFLQRLRDDPSVWQTCLTLFLRIPPLVEVVRVFTLDFVTHTIQTQNLDGESLPNIKQALQDYIRTQYGQDGANSVADPPFIQNKLAQALTLLFTIMYPASWETFFDDLWMPAQRELSSSASHYSATLFYLRVLSSVHDEIADVMLSHSTERQRLYTELKDQIRIRDANKIAASWQQILAKWQTLNSSTTVSCLKAISRWVSWTEITLVANEELLTQLYQIAAQDPSRSRDTAASTYAAIDVFSEIISKKMPPAAKIGLINSLNVEAILTQLVSSPMLQDKRGSSEYDVDMAEAVARLVNSVVTDVVKVLDGTQVDGQTRQAAENLIRSTAPHLLRFFSDEYDEVCSLVIPSLSDLLTLLRKMVKQRQSLPEPYADMLSPILTAIITKMRYDESAEWGDDESETDDAEFQELRKRLRVLQQIVAATNETLFLNVVGDLIANTFSSLHSSGGRIDWRDLDVALVEMCLLGETATKNGGLYQKRAPTSDASSRLIQLMSAMVESDLASYSHPAVHLQYMELVVRFSSFFEHHSQLIPKVLGNFVTFMHDDNIKVRTRSWHFFHRFVRSLRQQLSNISETVVQAIGDLLNIQAEVPTDHGADEMSSDQEASSADAVFQSQLFLFEAIGCIASAPNVSLETQMNITTSILLPLTSGLRDHLNPALSGDERSVFQIHHLMQAVGTLARGFSEWTPEKSSKHVAPSIAAEFSTASDAILTALAALKASITVREGARFAFSRLIGVLGFKIAEQLPQWIEGLLASSSTKDEIATFLRLLDQMIYGFKTQIRDVLDALLTPLLTRIFEGFAKPPVGTDDALHLGELRREYLAFVSLLLTNDLDAVLVSPANQGIFETIIAAIEHFAKDTGEYTDGKLAISVIVRMCEVWGGPSIQNASTSDASPSPSLPGFDNFMLTRFSAMTWSIMTNPDFDPKDPSGNRVVGEIATLQQTILAKTGRTYLIWLQDTELKNLGAQEAMISDYVQALCSNDSRGFKQYLLGFLQQNKG